MKGANRRPSSENSRGPGRRKVADSGSVRERLESVALELFAERHFDSVSVRDIGKAADVNPAMIYYHFRDKEDLFRAALQNAVHEAFKLFEKQSKSLPYQSAVEAIDAWFDVHVRLHHQLRNVIKISVDSSTIKAKNSFSSDPVAEFYQREGEILQLIIEKGIASEDFQSVNPRRTAIMISTILDGAMTRTFILDDFDLKATIDDFKKMIRLHLLTPVNKTNLALGAP